MRVHKLFTLIITAGLTIYLSLAVIAFATDVERTILTLDKAIEIATANNTIIKEAIENQKAVIEERKSARSDFFPKASAAYSYTRLKDGPYSIMGGTQIDVGDNDQYHWDLTLSQPIFTGLAQLESHVRDAEKFYEQGMIAYNDFLKPKVALADALQNRVRAESNVEMAISAFNTLLQIDLNRKTDVEDILGITPFPYDLDTLINEAMEKRPELRTLCFAIKNSDYAVTLAQSSYYPEVGLVGSYDIF
jgi:outer membrane protein TolC